jgi:tRNA-splicing ligase RtcB
MIEVIYKKEENRVPIKSWVTNLEENALKQAINLSNLPFVFRHVALMPDCHAGYGMPIGGVIATKGYVIPNAVGKDIGCGMCAIKSNIKVEDFNIETLKQIMGEIRKQIPVGFDHHKNPCDVSEMPGGHRLYKMDMNNSSLPICCQEFESALNQLGTLGGGNHFIEIQKGSDGFVWVMIHSGSRNLGLKVADYYNKLAEQINEKWHSEVTKDKELAFLPIESAEGQQYLEEMEYCLKFAYANRLKMMNTIKDIFKSIVSEVKFDDMINIHHNYAIMENHFGENVMIHRKGATSAREGQIGIIPGSQGTCSYIVEGLGNPESFQSCSHGAGRKMGRNEAIKTLNLEEEKKKLNDKGILHAIRSSKDLDEAPGSYKDINVVMENQKDLVKILIKLEPLGVIKG